MRIAKKLMVVALSGALLCATAALPAFAAQADGCNQSVLATDDDTYTPPVGATIASLNPGSQYYPMFMSMKVLACKFTLPAATSIQLKLTFDSYSSTDVEHVVAELVRADCKEGTQVASYVFKGKSSPYEINIENLSAGTYYFNISDTTGDEIPNFYINYDVVKHVVRLAGDTRYDTMSAIVAAGFEEGSCSNVIVASGSNFPDALAASALAGSLNAPVVLTDPQSLSSQAASIIKRLKSSSGMKATIVGGTAAVSDTVKAQIEALGVTTARAAGSTRQGTARAIYAAGDFTGTKTCIIATANSFADALSVSPYAYATSTPIFLTGSDGTLDDETASLINRSGFRNAILVGGTAAVSDTVSRQLYLLDCKRVSGSDRYATSAEIAKYAVNAGVLSYDSAAIATGRNFPDALAGAAFCGSKGSVLLLADDGADTCISSGSAYKNARGKLYNAYVLGGTGAVSEAIESTIKTALGGL